MGNLGIYRAEEPSAHEPFLHCWHWHAGYSLLRAWHHEHCLWSCSNGYPLLRAELCQGRRSLGFCPTDEHHLALPADDNDRLLFLCGNRYTFRGKHTHGPELSRGCLHAGKLSEPRPVWRQSLALRPALFRSRKDGGKGSVLCPCKHRGCTPVPARGEEVRERARPL